MSSPSDAELYDQLLGYLAAEGAIVEDDDCIVITEFDHRRLDQPLRLQLSPTTFGAHLRRGGSDANGLYPDIPPLEAAWRVFIVHLDEAVRTARPDETELVLVRGGVLSRRPDGTRTPLPREIEERVALKEHHERLIRHYADRGEMTMDVQREALALHTLDGRAFDPPLRVHVAAEELRRRIQAADSVEAAWSAVVEQIDHLATLVDPRYEEIVLTRDGVVTASGPARPGA